MFYFKAINRPFKIGITGLFESVRESTNNEDISPRILHEPFCEVYYGGFRFLGATRAFTDSIEVFAVPEAVIALSNDFSKINFWLYV